jgi:hypothetical protein
LYAKRGSSPSVISNRFHSSIENEHYVFIAASAQETAYTTDSIFMDAAMQIPLARSNPDHEVRGFYVRYDRETGEYHNHGIIPAELRSYAGVFPAVINNHVLLSGRYTFPIATGNMIIARFRDDGVLMETDTIQCPITNTAIPLGVVVNESGYLFTDFMSGSSSATFGEITINQFLPGTPAAYFGMMYDPSLLVPYPVNIVEEPSPASSLFILYPNPTNADINIRLFVEETRFEKVELYSVQGQRIGEYRNLHIPTASLLSGVYLVRVYIDGDVVVDKFLKAK